MKVIGQAVLDINESDWAITVHGYKCTSHFSGSGYKESDWQTVLDINESDWASGSGPMKVIGSI